MAGYCKAIPYGCNYTLEPLQHKKEPPPSAEVLGGANRTSIECVQRS